MSKVKKSKINYFNIFLNKKIFLKNNLYHISNMQLIFTTVNAILHLLTKIMKD
jgi:hypothetical protein